MIYDTYSNALAFVTKLLIGLRQQFATVYTAIYCREPFGVINYVTFRWMTRGIMRLTTLNLRRNCRSALVFKTFIRGGITLGIRSIITFYGSACTSP